MLFAAGAVAFENITREEARRLHLYRLDRGFGLSPCAHGAPILPVRRTSIIKGDRFQPPKTENQPTGPLPQHFADEFGWEEMARGSWTNLQRLPPKRVVTAIFANSYGQAGRSILGKN
jgi:hypothetical protein